MSLTNYLEGITTKAEIAREAAVQKPTVKDVLEVREALTPAKIKVLHAIRAIIGKKRKAIDLLENELNKVQNAA
jgi:hypothetical protein